MRFGTTAWALAIAVAVALAWSPAPAQAQGSLEFVPTPEPIGPAVFIRPARTERSDGILVLEFWVKDVTDLYGVAFDLRYPKKLFKFPAGRATSAVQGNFLNEDGAAETNLVVRRTKEGNLVVGISRLGPVEGVSGTGHLLSIELRGINVAGSKKIRYRKARPVDSKLEIFQDVVFRSGKAVVQVSE